MNDRYFTLINLITVCYGRVRSPPPPNETGCMHVGTPSKWAFAGSYIHCRDGDQATLILTIFLLCDLSLTHNPYKASQTLTLVICFNNSQMLYMHTQACPLSITFHVITLYMQSIPVAHHSICYTTMFSSPPDYCVSLMRLSACIPSRTWHWTARKEKRYSFNLYCSSTDIF